MKLSQKKREKRVEEFIKKDLREGINNFININPKLDFNCFGRRSS